MITTTSPLPITDTEAYARIAEVLNRQGYVILDRMFSVAQLQSLFIDVKQTSSDCFHPAGIGRELDHQLNRFVRRDRIRWLDPGYQPARFYLNWSEGLRQYLNRTLFLGLFDFECHYSHYPRGAFYKTHLDAFKGNSNRRLSSILYLNPAWQPGDGGELVMYTGDDGARLETITPVFGRMVIFLSEEFPHEVLPTQCSRYSLTGWYRVNVTTAQTLDPPV